MMNIEDLKFAWRDYDNKLQSTKRLSDQIIRSMIRERSESRLSSIIRRHLYVLLYMLFWLCAGLAILLGNPFDYTRPLEYIPAGIFCAAMAILIARLYKAYSELSIVSFNIDTVESSLKKIILIHERPDKFSSYATRLLLVSAAILFPLSFLPRKIHTLGFWPGLMDIMIPIAISLATVWAGYKLGVFKNRHAGKFRKDMEELNNLKRLSAEISENNHG